jgi:sterol desaturase/sphingolipid hydroxylase (fatty acid hydroxylase superfamily)
VEERLSYFLVGIIVVSHCVIERTQELLPVMSVFAAIHFVTPDMHRIHHSEEVREQSRNLGDIFPWWDRLFRTYLEIPAAGQDGLVVGLRGFQNGESLNLTFMFSYPFRHQPQEVTSQETPVAGLD